MDIRIDHVVLWVEDPLRSVEFYERVLGAAGLRVAEFTARKVLFPSVRLSSDTIIDLMPLAAAPMLNGMPGGEGSAGNKVHHLCFALAESDYRALRARLEANGVAVPVTMKDSFGARGQAPEAIYFRDPDGNVLEARYYAE
jgi:catechol 2,3-dioxygenase-like lactoylglutathione lyase family enzyme